MSVARHYGSGPALRTALEERLKRIASEEGVDLQRLRRQVAFDRFLARLFSKPQTEWVLKGGYAMELRFQAARATKDLDFTVKAAPAGPGDMLLAHLQDVGSIEATDFFLFRIGEAMMDLDAAPYGGARYPVEAIMGDRTFVKFHVDVGLGDIVLDPVETVRGRNWLGFAGIKAPVISIIPPEQQFAEKLHAYTLPRGTSRNSRVRDLVDMVLLIRSGKLNTLLVKSALNQTYARRGTHELVAQLSPPPDDWSKPFEALASECSLNMDFKRAFEEVNTYFQHLEISAQS